MPTRQYKQALSHLEIEERAATARDFIDNPMIQGMFDGMRSRQLGILMNAEIGSLTASAAHAMLLAIEGVQGELESIVTDKKMLNSRDKTNE